MIGAGAWYSVDAWRTRRHFRKVMREPGHFDHLDKDCIRIIGLTSQDEVDHLNDWPARQKEAFRLNLCRAYRHGTRITVLWQRVRELHEDRTYIMPVEDGSGDTVVQFIQAR